MAIFHRTINLSGKTEYNSKHVITDILSSFVFVVFYLVRPCFLGFNKLMDILNRKSYIVTLCMFNIITNVG